MLQIAVAAASTGSAFVHAQPGKSANGGNSFTVAQIVDVSNAQQDVSKDFLIGARAAWQDINLRGGIRGRKVQHASYEIDGSPEQLRSAMDAVRGNPGCVALSGTASDPLARQLTQLLRRDDLALAHVAPWLQAATEDTDGRTFPIFATRQEQIGFAVKSLSVMGVQDLGVVYASPLEFSLYRSDVERVAGSLGLRSVPFGPSPDLAELGQRIRVDAPAILLFVGGTPELVQFTQGLERQSRQRYVVALADVNLQTVLQMGAARRNPLIATQVVPVTSASLPVVRAYREIMGRLFDEPPTALSLAGFISARYTAQVIAEVDGTPTRQSVLAAFGRLATQDLGGFRVGFAGQRRMAGYVTQSMLTADGRVVG